MTKAILFSLSSVMVFGLALAGAPSIGLAASKSPIIPSKKSVAKTAPKTVELTPVSASTKCLTPEIKNLYQAAKTNAEEEIKRAGTGVEDAAKKYREDIETVWAAMHEPYCGYGSRGVQAVKNSFNKSVNKSKEKFAAAIKK